MKTRILRFLLPAILIAAGAGGVAWTWALAQHVEQIEATGRQTATRIDRLEGLLDELTQNELDVRRVGRNRRRPLQSTSNLLRQIVADSSWLLGQLAAGSAPSAGEVAKAVATLGEVEARARENMLRGPRSEGRRSALHGNHAYASDVARAAAERSGSRNRRRLLTAGRTI